MRERDGLTADEHYATAMDFRIESRTMGLDGEQRMLARAQFHATMAVAARLAANAPVSDDGHLITRNEYNSRLRQALIELRGPIPKDDPDGLITRVRDLAIAVTMSEGHQVTVSQAADIAVALYNNGLLRKNDD